MRAHVLAGAVVGVAGILVASAVAFAQAGGAPSATPAATSPSNDAGAPSATAAGTSSSATSGTASSADAGVPSVGGAASDSGIGAASVKSAPPDAHPAEATSGDDEGFNPSNVGFSVTLRSGYSLPFGAANGSPLKGVVQGVVPIGAEAGWFFNPHLYLGGYFIYGFGVAPNQNNDLCSSTVDETCSGTMLRFGVVVRWHFHPEPLVLGSTAPQFDPWVGAGLGYDIINLSADDPDTGTLDGSGSLHGFDLTLDTGIDYKPLPYVGLGPYVELASGHYSADASAISLHEWVTFGFRVRTNL